MSCHRRIQYETATLQLSIQYDRNLNIRSAIFMIIAKAIKLVLITNVRGMVFKWLCKSSGLRLLFAAIDRCLIPLPTPGNRPCVAAFCHLWFDRTKMDVLPVVYGEYSIQSISHLYDIRVHAGVCVCACTCMHQVCTSMNAHACMCA